MEHGIFDPDILYTFIRLDELKIDPQLPYSSEHGLDASSEVYQRYQRALVHEKCHYYTTLSSSLFVRRILAKLEIAWQLSSPTVSRQAPLANLETPSNEIQFWLYQFCADQMYFDNLVNGKELDHNRQVQYLIRSDGVGRIAQHYGWGYEDLKAIYSRTSFTSLRAIALAEGLAKAQEYLMAKDWGRSSKELETEHFDLAADMFADNSVYTTAIDFFRSYFASVDFCDCLPVFTVFAEAALSPPVCRSGSWPTVASKHFSLNEILPQTRFESLCDYFKERLDLFSMSRGEIMRELEAFFDICGWQTPLQTAALMKSRLEDPSINSLAYKAVQQFGHASPSLEVPADFEEIGDWIMSIRAQHWKDTLAMAAAKTYDPYTASPPYNLGLFNCYKIAARNVVDFAEGAMMQLAYALLLLKLPSAIPKYRIFGNKENCVVNSMDSACLPRRQFSDAAERQEETCPCSMSDRVPHLKSHLCSYGRLLNVSTGWSFND